MYKLTIADVNADTRGDKLNGVFDTIPETIEYLLSQYLTFTDIQIIAQGPNKWNVWITPIVTSYLFIMEEVSLTELADKAYESLGLEAYDTALPIQWCDDVKAKTGTWPYGFVWGYGKGVWGMPIPLTTKAIQLLEAYNAPK